MASFGLRSNKAPCPHVTIGCQELLATKEVSFSGTLMKPVKKCTRNSFICPLVEKIPWVHRYVLLYQGSLYYYSDSLSKKPSGSYSLYGFHQVVRAGDVRIKKYPWTFKIVNLANPDRCKYFAAGSEREMKEWMVEIKKQLFVANADLLNNVKVNSQPTDDDDDVEKSIYGEDVQRVLSGTPGITHRESISSSEHNTDPESSSDEYDEINEERMARPLPAIPPEERSTPGSAGSAVNRPKVVGVKPPMPGDLPKKAAGLPPPVKPKPKPRALLPGKEESQMTSLTKLPPPPEMSNTGLKFDDIYWDGTDKQIADQIIRNIGEEGVFMVRQSDNPQCVKTLVCYIGDRPTKFMIKQNVDNQLYFIQDSFSFLTILDLIEHYRHNNLPKKMTPLTYPYTKYTQ